MYTFPRRFKIIALAITRPAHSLTISGNHGGIYTGASKQFFRRAQGRNCPIYKARTHFTAE